ncbi:MAG: hypothetical protein V4616_09940 [Bacteroidota bacterium]
MKLRSSSLIETIIALLIITIVFALSVEIYNTLVISSGGLKQERAMNLADQYITQLISNPGGASPGQTTSKQDGLVTVTTIEYLTGTTSTLLVSVSVNDEKGKHLAKKTTLIHR